MEQSLEKRTELKDRIIIFYKKNKLYFFLFIFLSFLFLAFLFYMDVKERNNNKLISEKYILAGIFLSQDKNEQALNLYNEIIFDQNEFYSVLALNTVLEKNLIKNEEKILKYFETIEKKINLRDQKDLITFKKALFLIKISDKQRGETLLKDLIEKESKYKELAELAISQ